VSGKALTGGTVRVEQNAERIAVTRRGVSPDEGDIIVRLELDAPLQNVDVIDVPIARPREMENVAVSLTRMPGGQYEGRGAESLVDGVRGTTDRMDAAWLGFESEDCEAVLDFHAAKKLSRVSVGCLQEQVSWIFYPKAIEIAVSDDGTSFRQVGRIDDGAARRDAEIRPHDFSVSFAPVAARYLRVRALNRGVCPPWHEAAGNKAWLFVDEIRVK
jgi:hypothetical protein